MSGELLIQSIHHFRNEKGTGTSGGSKRGIRGARVPPSPLLLDQTEAWIYLRVWMTGPLPYLKVWTRHWEPKCVPAFVSGIVTWKGRVNYWPTFSPIPSNGPKSLQKVTCPIFLLDSNVTNGCMASIRSPSNWWAPASIYLFLEISIFCTQNIEISIVLHVKFWNFKILHARYWNFKILQVKSLNFKFLHAKSWNFKIPQLSAPFFLLDQTEARRAVKNCFETRPPLISGSRWPGRSLIWRSGPATGNQNVFPHLFLGL